VDALERQEVWRRDARILGEVGKVLLGASLPKVEVHLPRALAEDAVAAWSRDDDDTSPLGHETCEQRIERRRAATLALIGLSITEGGRWDDTEVVVDLDPEDVGMAMEAVDDLP